MEQWNESDCKLSLNKLMEIRYIFKVLYEQEIDLDELSGNNVSDLLKKIEEIELNCIDADGITSKKENYIKDRKEVLFKILDTVIENSAHQLAYGNTGRYHLNRLNCEFISKLLDDYEEETYNIKDILNGKYDKVKPSKVHYTYNRLLNEEYDMLDDTTLDFLYKGLIDLAENEETNLQIETVNHEWNIRFKPVLREISDLLDELKINVEYCRGMVVVEGKNLEKLEYIKKMLRKYNDAIKLMSNDMIPYDIELGTDFSTYSSSNYGSFIDSDFGVGFELDSDFEIENLVESILPLIKLHAVNESKRKDKK